MMNTIITVLLTCPHPREAEAEAGGEVILTPLTITAMKTITITMDTTTTTTGEVTMTRTTGMMTSRGLGEYEAQGEECAVVPVRPGAAVVSHRGAGWASPSEEALEQAEVHLIIQSDTLIFTLTFNVEHFILSLCLCIPGKMTAQCGCLPIGM